MKKSSLFVAIMMVATLANVLSGKDNNGTMFPNVNFILIFGITFLLDVIENKE